MIELNWQELKKPEKRNVSYDEHNSNKATMTIDPFERGFGVTVGNSLRRVLLSSLQGAAITSIQIQGVLHEFSSIAGVNEDVTDIVLNLKGVAVKMSVEGPKRLRLNAEGTLCGYGWYDQSGQWR
jgi:DNA-directed RNA polymerase subunit alpha